MLRDFTRFALTGKDKLDDKEEIGIGGFTAEVRLSESIQFTSDVPDNYLEDGSVVNDHIINNPIMLTLDGEVSDIHIKAEFPSDILLKTFDKAAEIANLVYPSNKTQQMLQKVNKYAVTLTDAYSKLDNIEKRGQKLYDMFGNKDKNKSTQDKFFEVMNGYYYSKELIDIEMPFQTYKNMRITSLTIIRDNTTNQALKYKISAKEVRFADTILVDKNKYFKKPTDSTKDKVSDKKNKGVVDGAKESAESTLYKIKKALG